MSKPAPKFWNAEGKLRLRGSEDTFEYHQWDILPWDYFIFFKVSRLVPEDVQREMNYNIEELKKWDIPVISNNPRKSPSEYWLRKTGVLVKPRQVFLNFVVSGIFLVFLGLFIKRRRLPLINDMCVKLMKRPLSPRHRMGLSMRKKQGHDHNTWQVFPKFNNGWNLNIPYNGWNSSIPYCSR